MATKRKSKRCPKCKGTGKTPSSIPGFKRTCGRCSGTGKVRG